MSAALRPQHYLRVVTVKWCPQIQITTHCLIIGSGIRNTLPIGIFYTGVFCQAGGTLYRHPGVKCRAKPKITESIMLSNGPSSQMQFQIFQIQQITIG